MARIDWAILCDVAFFDRQDRLCTIGVITSSLFAWWQPAGEPAPPWIHRYVLAVGHDHISVRSWRDHEFASKLRSSAMRQADAIRPYGESRAALAQVSDPPGTGAIRKRR